MHLSFESCFEYDLFISKFSEHYYLMTKTLIMLLCLFFPFHIISEELNGENLLFIPPDDLEFKSAKAIILDKSKPALEELSKVLQEKDDWRLEISGHTDNVGSAASNLTLSKKRAESVKQFLMENGVKESHLIVKYFGETDPIADNNTAEGRQKNRRWHTKISWCKDCNLSFKDIQRLDLKNFRMIKSSGLPKAEIFGRNRIFSLFGFRFRPPKFYSRYSAFGFVLKMSCF